MSPEGQSLMKYFICLTLKDASCPQKLQLQLMELMNYKKICLICHYF